MCPQIVNFGIGTLFYGLSHAMFFFLPRNPKQILLNASKTMKRFSEEPQLCLANTCGSITHTDLPQPLRLRALPLHQLRHNKSCTFQHLYSQHRFLFFSFWFCSFSFYFLWKISDTNLHGHLMSSLWENILLLQRLATLQPLRSIVSYVL